MDCLFASVNIIITDCCLAELEKLGPQYRLALMSECLQLLRLLEALLPIMILTTRPPLAARDERWTRLSCDHKGTYADDVSLQHPFQHGWIQS